MPTTPLLGVRWGFETASNDYETIILSIEDPTFYQHFGIDISIGQGMTTMTSSLAREIFLFGGELKGWKGLMQSFYRGFFNAAKKLILGVI